MKSKNDVEAELYNLEQKHKIEFNKFIIKFFGERSDAEFVYELTKTYGRIILSQDIKDTHIKDTLVQYNTDITAKVDSNLVNAVESSIEKVMAEITDEYTNLLLIQREEYKQAANQFHEDDWFLKKVMTQNYFCGHTKDQLKGMMTSEDKNDIYVLAINKICKEKKASQNNFVNFIENQDKHSQQANLQQTI